VPTGVAIRDVREQLFDAAKGVLHRHFTDFDAFLADFVLDRIGRLDTQAAALLACAGTGTVTGNLAAALTALYGSVAVATVGLVAARDGLRERLREAWPAGVPVLTVGMVMITSYLSAERGLGRIAPDAEVDMLGPALLGGVHMLFVSRENVPPEPEAIARVVTTVLAGVVR
jgi:AcrR family transcriptional regulator